MNPSAAVPFRPPSRWLGLLVNHVSSPEHQKTRCVTLHT
jgi:hypothetical protein